jgi:hypothetical protein
VEVCPPPICLPETGVCLQRQSFYPCLAIAALTLCTVPLPTFSSRAVFRTPLPEVSESRMASSTFRPIRARPIGFPLLVPHCLLIDLTSADLTNANLIYADLSHARLSHAKLVSADLSAVKLVAAALDGADLTGARLFTTDLTDANLDGTKGLTQKELDFACGTGVKGLDKIDPPLTFKDKPCKEN